VTQTCEGMYVVFVPFTAIYLGPGRHRPTPYLGTCRSTTEHDGRTAQHIQCCRRSGARGRPATLMSISRLQLMATVPPSRTRTRTRTRTHGLSLCQVRRPARARTHTAAPGPCLCRPPFSYDPPPNRPNNKERTVSGSGGPKILV
jgi:hypothetical protein